MLLHYFIKFLHLQLADVSESPGCPTTKLLAGQTSLVQLISHRPEEKASSGTTLKRSLPEGLLGVAQVFDTSDHTSLLARVGVLVHLSTEENFYF